jgi:hypothetical protein
LAPNSTVPNLLQGSHIGINTPSRSLGESEGQIKKKKMLAAYRYPQWQEVMTQGFWMIIRNAFDGKKKA